MPTLTFEPRTHRLRIAGACPAGALPELCAAVERSAGETTGNLIVDLTAVTDLDPDVAEDLLATARDAASTQHVRCVFLRRLGSPVDEVLTAAEHGSRGG